MPRSNERTLIELPDGRVVEQHERDSDEEGRTVTHYRTVDTIGIMERAGTIDAEHRMAADDFRRDFHYANMSSVTLSSLNERVDNSRDNPPPFREFAASRLFKDIQAMGGIHTVLSSIAWDVVGLEISLNEWAAGQRWSRAQASGILVAALGVLAVSRGHLSDVVLNRQGAP